MNLFDRTLRIVFQASAAFQVLLGIAFWTGHSLPLIPLHMAVGLLFVIWGLDKLVNPEHAIAVSDTFYFGLLSAPALQPILGILETALGLAVILGVARRYAYPVGVLVTGVTLLCVWKSILDPWGWYLGEGANVFFFPSLIVFAGALVLAAFRDQDTMCLQKGA